MNILTVLKKHERINWYSAMLLSVVFLNIGIVLSPSKNSSPAVIKYAFLLMTGASSFLLFYLKKGNNIRRLLFSAMSVIMSVWFMTTFFEARNHIGFTQSDLDKGIPFCHLAFVNQLLSLPALKMFVSPSNLNGSHAIYPMFLIWFWSTILMGKGWCSWGCFYGGWDNLFAGILKKPVVRIPENISNKLRFLPYAMLAVIAVLSLYLITPVLCIYICPFKTVTEFQQVESVRTWLLFLITVSGFLLFCIMLPVIFGKRIWCTYLCPFGALQGLTGRIFRVFMLKIDKDSCIDCKKCVRVCKTSGITEESLAKKKFTVSCSLCGICVDNCPKNAIKASVIGITGSVKELFDRITVKISNIKILGNIRGILSGIIGDVLNPYSFLLFFGLTVLVNFLSTFYFELFYLIIK